MRAFREVVDDCALQDLGWAGVEYTWDNMQHGAANVKARLDRALANTELLDIFVESRVRHVSSIESDHCFLVVELREHQNNWNKKGMKQFRYENVWQSHADYDELISESWQRLHQGAGLAGIASPLGKMQGELGA